MQPKAHSELVALQKYRVQAVLFTNIMSAAIIDSIGTVIVGALPLVLTRIFRIGKNFVLVISLFPTSLFSYSLFRTTFPLFSILNTLQSRVRDLL